MTENALLAFAEVIMLANANVVIAVCSYCIHDAPLQCGGAAERSEAEGGAKRSFA